MGRQKFGALIRKLDYTKVKGEEGDPEHPSTKLTDLRDLIDEEEGEIKFDEIKDGYAAFEQKVCVKGFPEYDTPGYSVAETTLGILESFMSDFIGEHEEKTKAGAEVLLHTVNALFKAGPNSSHIDLMSKLFDTTPSIDEYIKGMDKKSLLSVLDMMKIQFVYPKNKECDEETYGGHVRGRLEELSKMFSEEQLKAIRKEFLELFIYYHSQIPGLSEDFGDQIDYLVRGMVENFEEENPYLGLKDTALIKKHITAIKDMVCTKGYVFEKAADQAAERTLKKIMKSLTADTGLLKEVFDHVMSTIIELSKNPVAQKEGKNIFGVFRRLFDVMGEKVEPTPAILKGCVNMVSTLGSNESMSKAAQEMVKECLEGVILKAEKLSPEAMKQVLKMITTFLHSGRIKLVEKAKDILENMKEKNCLDWKSHIEEAKEFLIDIGEIDEETMTIANPKEDVDDAVSMYLDFLEVFLPQLKKNKVIPEIQPNLLTFFFDCMSVSIPVKTELAEHVSDNGYLDFSKDKDNRILVLQKCEGLLKNKRLPWTNIDFTLAVTNVLDVVIKAYKGNGKSVSPEENELFISIFKSCGEGTSVEDHFYEDGDSENISVYGRVYQSILMSYVQMHQETSTLECISPVMPDVLRWARIATEENHSDMSSILFAILSWVGQAAPTSIKDSLPLVIDLLLVSEKTGELYSLVTQLYPHNPKAVHSRLQDLFDRYDSLKDTQRQIYLTIFYNVAQSHAEVFTAPMVTKLIEMYKNAAESSKPLILFILKSTAEKNPKLLVEFFPQMCDDTIFKPATMNQRSGIIACIGGINAKLGQQAVDYLMKFASHSDPTVSQMAIGTASNMTRDHVEYMQKHKTVLQTLEKSSTIPQVREVAHEMILILEGKSVENIADDLEQHQEDLADLDVKVDATIGTVITIGDTVVKHDQEIGELQEGLEEVEERVDDVEEDLGDTKIKVEEIDNKTMSNAPKWSRDLTKLMNPKAENDWRLLASRLGYKNEDIRGWATQHDPCMALLSEWYATHKTSEASYGVLTALTEMNRMDGVVIVENAMKAAEGVVEDEEFEYPSPPPIFISYQWGVQNEVKLLKQHLNMAGYECWLDVGQMGGGDKLFAKIDNGIRGAKIVICCVTEKYAKSPNCNREVNLSVNLNKPVIPLLMEQMEWPPKGSMGPIFSEYLFIRFFQRGGEETKDKDQRYWPVPKFQELLMQLNFYVVPDQKMVKKEYAKWWAPMVEDIVIDKNKGKKQPANQSSKQTDSQVSKTDENPLVFLSYQWGKQPQIKALYRRLTSMGYTVWMDIYQMGGGDSLYDKIDRGMRGCRAVVSCMTKKYSLSANCRREVSLADALKKPIIPILMEEMKWPPDGPMSMVFTELLYINFYKDDTVQMTWKGETFDELMGKLGQFVPASTEQGKSKNNGKTPAVTAASKTTAKKPVPQASSNKDKLNTAEKNDVKSKDKIENNQGNAKAAPKNATNANSKATPSGKTSTNGSRTEPKSTPKLNSAAARGSEASKQQTGKDSLKPVAVVKPKPVSEQQPKQNDQKQISNDPPAKSKSCNIL